MFKKLYKDYPQASQLYTMTPKKVCYLFFTSKWTVDQICFRNQWMALFFHLRRRLHQTWKLQALHWNLQLWEKWERLGGLQFPKWTGKEKLKKLKNSLLKIQKRLVPSIIWLVQAQYYYSLRVSTLLHFSVLFSVFNTTLILFLQIVLIELL